MYKTIFGPVNSRRLGFSLGIDLVTHKTCSFDCVYCECGKTTDLTVERKNWVSSETVKSELNDFFLKNQNIKLNHLTFSGSGEPTLALNLGEIIIYLKEKFKYPVCVLTNSSLINNDDVIKDLLPADIVMPSLDAVTEKIYNAIDRPHKSIRIKNIINGLIKFRKQYKGQLFLEILFVKGINDGEEELVKLSETADIIKPDKIFINTCIRPGTSKNIKYLTNEELNKIAGYFHLKTEIAYQSANNNLKTYIDDTDCKLENVVAEIIKRRPSTLEDLKSATGFQNSPIET
ncbi:radical SAM protein, partial [Candidatus Dependentiae bacterium]|nr:radical SAM protein [Candidatus Dependentiae bacterium]